MKIKPITLTIMLFILIAGCTKDNEDNDNGQNFVEAYGGKPFKGTAKGIRSQGGVSNYTWEGEGRVALTEATDDSVSLVFMADFDNQGEMNFKVRGAYDRSSYRMETTDPNIYFRIADQKISGVLNNVQQEMAFEGTMRRESTLMKMRVHFKEESDAFSAGSTLELIFDTGRKIEDNDNGEGCQMRLVPIWSPTGMTMGMVPDC